MAFDLIVIGGGPAGVTAALRARELGAATALVEKGALGGVCTNDGCLPTRVLAMAARLLRDAGRFSEFGLHVEPPTVDFPALLGRAQDRIYAVHEKKQLAAHLRRAGATLYNESGAARFDGPHTLRLEDGSTLEAEKFLLCAGGHGRRLPIPGGELALGHSDVWSMRRLPASGAIVGAAATGSQLASIFNTLGSRVILLELAPRLTPAEDPVVSEALAAAFRLRGIEVRVGIDGVQRLEATPAGVVAHWKEEGYPQRQEVEALIAAVGWVGNVEGLGLEAAGVAHERGYVTVDETFRTSAPHIYAAGDITGRMMLVQSATSVARVAAENALRGEGRAYRHDVVPHGGFTDPEYGSVGLTEEAARAQGDVLAVQIPYADSDRAVIDGRAEGFCKLIVDRATHRIVGAHVVGEQAVEIVHVAAAAMAAAMPVEQLAEREIAYPTYTAVLGLAAREIVRQVEGSAVSPPWRMLGRVPAEWEQAAD